MSGSGGFQQNVYDQPVFAIEGDFATQNPYFNYKAGAGGLVAGGPNGVKTGRFAWVYMPDDPDGTPTQVQNNGSGIVAGFVGRNMQALITNYLGYAGEVIQPGFQMYLFTGGDFWVTNAGTTTAQQGQKAFALLATGQVVFAAAGTIFGGASATASSIAAETWSATLTSLADAVLTVVGVVTGTIYPGSTVAGSGIAVGTQIQSQISGTPGGAGAYYVNVGGQSAPSQTVTGTYGLLTIGALVGTATFAVGDLVTGSGVAANTAITANVTGTGGTGGTMVVSNNTVVGSTTITASQAVETKWYATSSGVAGALVAISSHGPG